MQFAKTMFGPELSLAPTLHRLFSRIGASQQPDETLEIEAGCAWQLPPAIALPDELDRVTGHALDLDAAENLGRMTNSILQQGPTKAYLWKDAILADSCLLSRGRVAVLGKVRRHAFKTGSPERIEEIAICSTFQTEHYFGHWLLDGLAHELLAEEIKLPRRTFETNCWPHKLGYRGLTHLPAQPVDYAKIERLWILDDAELNHSRVRRINALRQRIRSSTNGKSEKVFLSRGRSGSGRTLINEEAVRQLLEDKGFAVVEPERLSALEIVTALKSAKIVISVEGSAMAHAILCAPEGAAIVTIQPPDQLNAVYRNYCGVLGFRFAFTVADSAGPDQFELAPERLTRLLDILQ